MRPKLAAYETWPAIALSYLLCLGLPIAPLLLWQRLGKDRTPRPVLAVFLLGYGLLTTGFFILMIFVPSKLPTPTAMYVWLVLLVLAHAGLAALGIAAFRNARRVERYAALLAANAPATVDQLAAKWNRLDVQNMVHELAAILDSGTLGAYRLDVGTRYVERVDAMAAAAAGPAQRVTFVCPSCGATNEGVVAAGGVARCEYCERVVGV